MPIDIQLKMNRLKNYRLKSLRTQAHPTTLQADKVNLDLLHTQKPKNKLNLYVINFK